MALPFGWCLDGLHEECKGSYTVMVTPVAEGRGKNKPQPVEVAGQCSCECHAS